MKVIIKNLKILHVLFSLLLMFIYIIILQTLPSLICELYKSTLFFFAFMPLCTVTQAPLTKDQFKVLQV